MCSDVLPFFLFLQRKQLARAIFKEHIDTASQQAVNIDAQCSAQLTADVIAQALPTLFDTAKKQIFQLMRTDSYPRFLKSELYKTSVRCELDGEPLPFSEVPTDSSATNGHATKQKMESGRESIGKKSKVSKTSSTREKCV